jgi:hypothetical protein
MSPVFAERPSFFEGQYLGADDLQAFLKYARESDARHVLGAHTWGIVAGIELVESTSPVGEVEYSLSPGVAVDGYGRLLVVTTPYKLTTDLFAQQPSGTVNVWIRYEETPFSGTRAGFQSCECSDAFARVAESVVVEVGPRATVDQRESGVVVDDQSFVDAREAPGNLLPNQPLACDGSVAAQMFPDAETRNLWLIPVGQVPWNKISSSLLASTEVDKKASLIFRRVAGLVTGHIYPASGVIRLRPRWGVRQAGVSADQICALSAIKEADLVTCNGQMSFREMIWLEGHSRFTGDVRLYGSRLEFQESQGTDYLKSGVPLALRRRPDRNEHNGFDLQVLLGTPQGADGPTRLTIGKATVQGTDPCALDFQFEPGVYIQQDAKLGIGTLNTLLSLPLTIRAIGDPGNLMGFEAADGALAWQMNFGVNKDGLNFTETSPTETRLFLRTGGNVGIGTLTPEAKLDIRNVPAPSSNALGAGKWFQVGDGDDKGRMWLQYGDQLAPLLVLSDFDDPPRLQFQQTGTGQETGPQFVSWIGHARNNAADLALMGGNVGVGTLQPFRRLHVEASEIHSGGAGAGFSFGNREDGAVDVPANGERWVWYSTGRVARLWSGGDKLFVTASGNLGIATATPAERLDVRGNIKLGTNGDFFGVGCIDNLRMVAGRISSTGVQQSGSGFSVSRTAVGLYLVTYNNAFSSIPVVVASLVDSLNQDNFLTIVSSTASGFELHSKDDDPNAAASYQDSAFNFIALGPRA